MQRLIPGVLAGVLAFSSMEAMAAADLLFFNGKVFTAEPGQPLVQAVAVANGKILKVGSDAEVKALTDADTRSIDRAGKVLMPGMIDTHSHPIMGAMASLRANLYDEVLPLDELERWVLEQDQAGTARMGELIVISGVSSAYWEQSAGLGNIFNRGRWAEQPLVLDGIDGHTGWANQAMLKRLKINAELVRGLSAKERGFIAHDGDFTPTGYLAENGWDRVRSQYPAPSEADMLAAAREAVKINNQVGVTAWMDAAANAGDGDSLFELRPSEQDLGVLPLYRALAEKGELSAHVAALRVGQGVQPGGEGFELGPGNRVVAERLQRHALHHGQGVAHPVIELVDQQLPLLFQLLALAAQFLRLLGVVPDIGIFGQAGNFFQTVFFTVVVKDTPGYQCCG